MYEYGLLIYRDGVNKKSHPSNCRCDIFINIRFLFIGCCQSQKKETYD